MNSIKLISCIFVLQECLPFFMSKREDLSPNLNPHSPKIDSVIVDQQRAAVGVSFS